MCNFILNIKHTNGESTLAKCETAADLDARIDQIKTLEGTSGYQIFSLTSNVKKSIAWVAFDESENQLPEIGDLPKEDIYAHQYPGHGAG